MVASIKEALGDGVSVILPPSPIRNFVAESSQLLGVVEISLGSGIWIRGVKNLGPFKMLKILG